MKIIVRLSAGTYTARTAGQRNTASSAESAEKAAQYLAKKLGIDPVRLLPEVSADGVFTFDVLESEHYERSPKLYAAPVAQAGQVPEGWRVMRCTSSVPREGDQWEIYDPQGSGGVVSVHDAKDCSVRGLLDALAATPAQGGE